ncbi:uncharacterized protein LOC108949319 isoform X2 [Ciona intestinalis]
MIHPRSSVFCSVLICILIAVQSTKSQVNRAVYHGSEILFFNTRKTYDASQTACQLISGDLVIIRNKALQDIITPYLDSSLPYWTAPWSTGYWIGGRRQANVTDWKWRDGTPLPQRGSVDIYQNWVGVEPNGALGSTWCAAMTPYNYVNPFSNIKGGWVDDDCTRTKYYICQRGLCARRPCQNNGTCVAMETNYRCDCPPGYIGGNCEIDLCASNPCQNKGTCNKIPANYTCSCVKGFGGRNCENDFCLPTPCQNNGTCIRKTNDYECKCEPGYGGKNCRIDFCVDYPCQNGGTCIKVERNSTCSCLPGFSGRSCETEKFQDFGNGCAIHINKIPSQMKSYEEAKIQCNSLQAELAIIKSNQSNVIITQYNQLWMDSQPLWLGGRESNSSWKWLDGSNVDGFNTSSMTHDGCLSTAVNGSWSAENCTRRIGYACEKLVDGGDLCSSSKCKNGGNCTASGCHFYCNCPLGFDGLLCEISNVENRAGWVKLTLLKPL